MAVLVKSSEFLKNRERLIHSHDFRRVNSTAQESLQKWCVRETAITGATMRTLTSSLSRVAFTARQMASNGTRKISGRGNGSI